MLIKLTGVPHPDLNNGQPQSLYVDASKVLIIERTRTAYAQEESAERHRQARQFLFEEVDRVGREVSELRSTIIPDNEHEAHEVDRWVRARQAAADLSNAYHLVSRIAGDPGYHPRVDCTCISLSCGTALEQGVMLSRVFVVELPDEVWAKVENAMGRKMVPTL